MVRKSIQMEQQATCSPSSEMQILEEKMLKVDGNSSLEQDILKQYNLGFMYEIGLGVPQDEKKAAKLYQKIAAQGYPAAQFSLGLMYAQGRGVPQDEKKAAELYQEAAEQGDVDAQIHLSVMYAQAKGVPRDKKRALMLYQQAARQGYARAKCILDLM